MDAITKLLDRGMEKFRDLFLAFQKECDPTIDHSVLQQFVVPLFPINWKLSALRIMSAVDLTAHLRYVNWHSARFRASKHDRDSSYEPSEAEGDANSKSALTRSKRPRASKPPPPQKFHNIAMDPIASSSNPVADASASAESSSSSKPKKISADKPKSSKDAKTSGAGHSGKGPNKRRKF
jgi:hypothetical protein